MSRYVEVWTETLSHIIDVKQVDDDYEPGKNEAWCTRQFYEENKNKFMAAKEKKSRFDNRRVQTYLIMKERHRATEEIVKIIEDNYVIKTTMRDDKPEMWYYDDGIYVPDGESLVRSVCREILGEATSPHIVGEVILKIKSDTYVKEENFFNEQNKNPYLLPVMNGLLDLKSRELRSFTPEIAYFSKIRAYYRPGADCPSIKHFLHEVTGSDEDFKALQELLGFILLRDYKYEKAFMLYGSHGRNGKSKLLELITRFVGAKNVSGVTLQDIEKDDFAISSLHNKLVNIAGDISNEAIRNTGRFKSLTGRDTLSANRKFKNRIDFINYAKIIFATNELPPVFTLSDAFWLRWALIDFPYRFLPEREIAALSEEEKVMARPQDQSIIDKISTQEELDGLLNFALDGLDRLERQKDFTSTLTAREVRKEWQRKSNSVAAFIEDEVAEAFDSYITKRDFLKSYKDYCEKHRVRIMSDKAIKETLKSMMGVSESMSTLEGLRVRVWNGIRWRGEKEDYL